jgi:phospholipid/cholesterol/gamma-HCH transport system permease protein
MVNPIAQLGFKSLQFVQQLGRMAVFAAAMVRSALTPPVRVALYVRELHKLGVLSLLIICVSGLTVGMVLGLQGYHTLVRFGAARSLGAVVGLTLIRELGPVLTALLVTGRAGSAATAEIGAMVATEQLDGLRMLSIDPVHLVATPKALALVSIMPLLAALFIVSGLFGGYMVGVGMMGLDPGSYMASLRAAIDYPSDIACSLFKSLVFGILVALIATYRGFTSAPTSEGVSASTTATVVIASVTVLLFDFVITALWGV